MSLIRGISRVVGFVRDVKILQISLGIVVGSVFWWGWMGLVAVVAAGFGIFVAKREVFRAWFGVLLGLVVVGVRCLFVSIDVPEHDISALNGSEVLVRVVATSEIFQNPENTRIVLEVRGVCEKDFWMSDEVKSGGSDVQEGDICESWGEQTGFLQVWMSRYPRIEEGEELVISGMIREPVDEEDATFSYREYLEKKGIRSVMFRPHVLVYGEVRESFVPGVIKGLKTWCLSRVYGALPEPHASLLAGILLGEKAGMPEEFSRALRVTGTTHIIAASGYNVTIVANMGISLFRKFHRRVGIVLAVLLVWGFVVLSGSSLPVVRAGVMITALYAAALLGRESVIHVALPLSAACMVLAQPDVIRDISFQLSFLSTVGLVYIVPVLKGVMTFVPAWAEESVLVTLAAIIATSPLTMSMFGVFSIIAPVANFIVIPMIGIIMVLGGILLVVRIPVLGMLATLAVWVPLDVFVKAITLLSQVPFGMVSVPSFSGILVFAAYGVMGCVVLSLSESTGVRG